MGEFRRVVDKWTIILILSVCCFTSVLFYQLNRNMESEELRVSSQDVYYYYNQMLTEYYGNLITMDDKQAKFLARAKIYMIQNMEQWSRLKEEDEEKYYGGNYEKRIESYRESAPEIYDYYQELKSQDSALLNQYVEKSDAIDMALSLYDSSVRYVEGYTEMIDSYIAQGDSMLMTDIYSAPSTFAHTNILKSKYDFRKLRNINVKPDNSQAVEKVASASTYINIFILLIILVCVFRFFDDRKNGLIYIVYSSKKGRGLLAAKRVAILAVVSIFSTIFIYMCQFIIAFHIYGGLQFMGNSLQSCQNYGTICFTSNKWIFILMLLVISASAVFMTGLIVWFLLAFFNNITAGMGIAVIILGISYVLYVSIPDKSMWALFKTINIWNAILPYNTIGSYGNVGFGTFIMNKINTMLVVYATGITVFSTGCVLEGIYIRTVRKMSIFDKINTRVKAACQKIVSRCSLLVMELYKILWVRKGIVVIGIIFVIVCNSGIKKGYIYDDDMSVAIKYYKEAEGMSLSDELTQIVQKYENEKEYWDNRLNDINISNKNNLGVYSRDDYVEASMQASLYRNGVDEIHRNVDNLKKLRDRGIEGVVTSPFAVEEMFGEKLYDHHKFYGLLSVIGLIFLLFGILSDDRRQNMKTLIHTSSNGRGKWFAVKAEAVLITTVALWATIFIPNLINVTRTYGVWDKTVIIQDYPLLSHIPIQMSLKEYLVCVMLWKLIVLISIAGIILLISSVFDYLRSLIISVALIFTHILCLLGFDRLYYLSIVSPLLISENWSRGSGQINGIVILILGIICWCITLYREGFRR
ncbi:MAG: hypothetical protein Q4F06_02835 [Eubacteriales bacterium]|nr:hypothetical protein [Eubacteriales bacterium]